MDELTLEGVGRPHCPDPGHEAHRVVRDGFRGKDPAKRQRFRCVNPADQGDWHRFALPVQRVVAPQHRCEGCAQLVPPHAGPVVPGGYHYLASVVAGALVDVATGDTFQQASARARAALALTVGAPGGDFSNHGSLTCHHECTTGPCFRVQCCGPLSGVFPGNRWPANVLTEASMRRPAPSLPGHQWSEQAGGCSCGWLTEDATLHATHVDDQIRHASRGVVDTARDFAGGHSPGTEQFATAQILPT